MLFISISIQKIPPQSYEVKKFLLECFKTNQFAYIFSGEKLTLFSMEVYMTFFNIVEMKIMTSLLHIFYLASKEKNKPAQHKI